MTSQKTLKAEGWSPQSPPAEDEDIWFHRQLLVEIIFGLYHSKKKWLEKMNMPAQPISLEEIWREFESRRSLIDHTKNSDGSSFWTLKWHDKRWIDRRVNEVACPTFYTNGIPKIISISAGLYAPNLENASRFGELRRTKNEAKT
jgi:hypothetical protein